MWRKLPRVIVALFFVYFWACSSGTKLQFHQPIGEQFIGVRRLVIAPGDGSAEVDLICNYLASRLAQSDYFLLFDRNNLNLILEQNQLTYENLKQLDSLGEIANKAALDGIIFSELKALEIPPDELGVEPVKKVVWTGEYERDQNGQIVEEIGPTGEPIKKKKFSLQTVEQHFRIRNAKMIVNFQLLDLGKNRFIFSQELTANYSSGKIIKEEEQPIPTDDQIKRILAQNMAEGFLQKIAPRTIKVKRPIETGMALVDSGAVYARAGRWSQAQEVWNKAEQIAQTDARVYYNLGLAAEALGEYRTAEIYYKKAELLDPKKKLYHQAIDRIRKIWQKK